MLPELKFRPSLSGVEQGRVFGFDGQVLPELKFRPSLSAAGAGFGGAVPAVLPELKFRPSLSDRIVGQGRGMHVVCCRN